LKDISKSKFIIEIKMRKTKIGRKEIKDFNKMIKEYERKAKIELLEEMIEENGLNIIQCPEVIPTLIFRKEIREYLEDKLVKLLKEKE